MYLTDVFTKNTQNEIIRGYDENTEINQIRVHRFTEGLDKPDRTFYINEFYEMQWIPAKSQNDQNIDWDVTVLITRAGTQDLDTPMFGKTDKDIGTNTNIFLKRFNQISEAVANLNELKILQGDIKPANIILETDEENPTEIIPALIDFDLSADWSSKPNSSNIFDPTLRYTEIKNDKYGYRMPTIEAYKNNDDLYFYTIHLLEDTFALAKTYLQLLKINNKKINRQDLRIRAIENLATYVTKENEFEFFQVPNSSIWSNMMNDIISKNLSDPISYVNQKICLFNGIFIVLNNNHCIA